MRTLVWTRCKRQARSRQSRQEPLLYYGVVWIGPRDLYVELAHAFIGGVEHANLVGTKFSEPKTVLVIDVAAARTRVAATSPPEFIGRDPEAAPGSWLLVAFGHGGGQAQYTNTVHTQDVDTALTAKHQSHILRPNV
jgi:hypothetical protein